MHDFMGAVPVQETVATDDQQLIEVDMPETDPETNISPVGIVEVDPAIDQMPVALPQEELQPPVRKLNSCSRKAQHVLLTSLFIGPVVE